VQRLVQENLQRDAECCVELSELRGLWGCNDYGAMKLVDLKKELTRVLGTNCRPEKRLKGRKYKNVYMGYKVLPTVM